MTDPTKDDLVRISRAFVEGVEELRKRLGIDCIAAIGVIKTGEQGFICPDCVVGNASREQIDVGLIQLCEHMDRVTEQLVASPLTTRQ